MNVFEQTAANTVLALEAFDTLFNRRDHVAAGWLRRKLGQGAKLPEPRRKQTNPF